MSTGRYHKGDISFSYPESWTLAEGDESNSVTVEGPKSGFWSLRLYEEPVTLEEVIESYTSAMDAQYDDLEVFEELDSIADYQAPGAKLSFFFQNWLVSSRIRVVEKDSLTYCIFWQAEDREFDEYEAVYRAINVSLLTDDR